MKKSAFSIRFKIITSMIFCFLFTSGIYAQEWNFDWDVRTDRYRKPTGIFDQTPFPITENSTTYKIKNDEYPNGKTFYLGTKYYVDGGSAGNDANAGTSFSSPKKTIKAAIATAGNGNITIIVRGAHDSFDGIYPEFNITLGTGNDDTHRWMLVGYNQERPIIDADSAGTSYHTFFSSGSTNAYATLQRLKMQNSYQTHLRLGSTSFKKDRYVNLIDCHGYNGTKSYSIIGDGNFYWLNADNGWIYHCTSEHSYGHGYKMGDGASNSILEWSIAKDIGWWQGTSLTIYERMHPAGLDFPCEGVHKNSNITVRYNIAQTTLFYGIQARNCPNFSIHHNEVFDCMHVDDVTGAENSRVSAHGQIIVLGYYADGADGECYGKLYSNYVHDSAESDGRGIGIGGVDNENYVEVYNNIISRNYRGIYYRGYGPGQTMKVKIYNNSIYQDSPDYGIISDNVTPSENDILDIKNNIIVQSGSGSCVSLDSDTTHSYNIFWGNIGVTLGTGEMQVDPLFKSERPSIVTDFILQDASPAQAAGNPIFDFSYDANNLDRGNSWDIGAFELEESKIELPDSTIIPPSNLSID